jgi:hypothetical protein
MPTTNTASVGLLPEPCALAVIMPVAPTSSKAHKEIMQFFLIFLFF